MPQIKFIQPDGKEHDVEADVGETVMRAALEGDVRGILADCGGALSCATCHIYVAPEWIERLPTPDEVEIDMIECAMYPRENSRLSCQIRVTSELDGLVVHVPKAQF